MHGIILAAAVAASAPDFDVVIEHGRVVDGTGAPWFRADVGIKGDRIVAVGDLRKRSAARRIDAHDDVVAPGFIDMLGQSELNVLVDNRVESKVRQGFTTEITGEGFSAAPMNERIKAELKPWLEKYKLDVDWTDFAGYFKRFAKTKSTINFAHFVGAAQVRGAVLGFDDVQPTPAQLAEMQKMVETAMEQGAVGVSSALIYPPGSYAKTPELLALAEAAAKHGGIYASHIRGENEAAQAALDEAIAIGRGAHIPVEIWHLKSAEKPNWGHMKDVVAKIESARAAGVDITADMYPYTAAMNDLMASLPEWSQAGGIDATIARLHDPAQRARILKETTEGAVAREGADNIFIYTVVNPSLTSLVGKKLSDIASSQKKSPAEALADIVELDRGQTIAVRFWMSEDDVQLGLKQPWVSIDCDAAGQAVDGPFAADSTHPRAFGTAPRVLGHYARDLHLFSLEEAVRKLTSLPARRTGLLDRGVIRPGMAADVVVFDPATIRDVATYDKPLAYADGIVFVVVNGKLVLDDGKMTAERPGRILQHTTN
jgi:dihydroorotase/N-acyl-D-amino-acid deacylase